MGMMAPPGADFTQPSAIPACLFAHFNLSPGKYKNPRNTRVLRGIFQKLKMLTGPFVIYIGAFRAAQRC